MKIVVNGEARFVPDSMTVRELLEQVDLGRAVCAVELNRNVVPRGQHAEQTLQDGDHLEIVTLVGGG